MVRLVTTVNLSPADITLFQSTRGNLLCYSGSSVLFGSRVVVEVLRLKNPVTSCAEGILCGNSSLLSQRRMRCSSFLWFHSSRLHLGLIHNSYNEEKTQQTVSTGTSKNHLYQTISIFTVMLLVESFTYRFRDAVVAEKWNHFLCFSVLWFLSRGFHRPVHRVWKVVNDVNLNLRPSLTTYGGFWPNVSDSVSATIIIKTPHEGMYFGRTAFIPPRDSEDRCQHAMTSVRRHVAAEHRTRTLDVGFSFHLSLVCMFSLCAVVTYATSPCFTLYMSSNWISISFPKKLFQGPGLLCVRMWRTVLVFFFVNAIRPRGLAGAGRTFNALRSPFGPVSTHCTWLPLTDKATERSTPTNSWDCQRLSEGKETSAVLFVSGPKRGSTYCQENFLSARDEFKEDQSPHSWGRRRPPDCCYQNTLPQPG